MGGVCVVNAFQIAVQTVSKVKFCSHFGSILIDSLHSHLVRVLHTLFVYHVICLPKVVTRFVCVCACVCVSCAACD